MVEMSKAMQHTDEQGFIGKLKANVATYKLRWLFATIIAIAASIYSNPQGFLNLWLTRDQQAMLMVDKKEFGQAALTFSDQRWIAYSYYANGEYSQAASMFSQLKGEDALFGEANALALAGNARSAITRYEQILDTNSEHIGAQKNLAILESFLKKQVRTKSKDGDSEQSDDVKEMSEEDLKNLKDSKPKYENSLSGEMWLQQVQQNPEKFLQKKFQQEYVDANR